MMENPSLNNSWRVAIAGAWILGNAGMFVYLTFYGNPANALHSWAQSGTFAVATGILTCYLGFKTAGDFVTALVTRKP